MVTFLRVEVHDPDTLVPCILTGVGLLPGTGQNGRSLGNDVTFQRWLSPRTLLRLQRK